MDRRTYLRGLGVGGLAGVAGCLEDALNVAEGDADEHSEYVREADERTILDPPERSRGDPEVAAYPVFGQEFPSFSLPDPLAEETVSREDFVGDRAVVMTFFFTSCSDGACPALLDRLRHVQQDAAERGYEDDVALLAMTFDPERDTADVLATYGDEMSIDYEADNWHFLRPETDDAVEDLDAETFGIGLQRIDDEDGEGSEDQEGQDDHDGDDGSDHDGNDSTDDHGGDDNDSTDDHGDSSDDHDHGEYTFQHNNLILLANEEGVVERAYPQALNPDLDGSIEDIVADARTVAQSTAPDPEQE